MVLQNNLLCAWDTITKLGHSVLHKKLQLQKEKLDMKLDFILMSQVSNKLYLMTTLLRYIMLIKMW